MREAQLMFLHVVFYYTVTDLIISHDMVSTKCEQKVGDLSHIGWYLWMDCVSKSPTNSYLVDKQTLLPPAEVQQVTAVGGADQSLKRGILVSLETSYLSTFR